MQISIDLALPCAQYVENSSPSRLCGEPTTEAVIVPDVDGTWELIPICTQHMNEARQGTDSPELSIGGSIISSRRSEL